MKKIFTIVTACISSAILVFMLVMGIVKRNVRFSYSSPETINIYNCSGSPIKANGYTDEDPAYDEILSQLNDVTNLSLLEWLVGCNSITTRVTQDQEGKYVTYNPDMRIENLAVELVFSTPQDVMVTIDGDTKILELWCLMFIMPVTNSFTDIVVYFSTTKDSSNRVASYQTYKPILLKGKTKNIYKYVNTNLK